MYELALIGLVHLPVYPAFIDYTLAEQQLFIGEGLAWVREMRRIDEGNVGYWDLYEEKLEWDQRYWGLLSAHNAVPHMRIQYMYALGEHLRIGREREFTIGFDPPRYWKSFRPKRVDPPEPIKPTG